MTTKQNPEAGGLGAQDDDAGGGLDVSTVPLGADVAPAWQCPGPGAGEVVALPFNLAAVLENRCEALRPNSALDLCDVCWAARRRVSS